MQLECMHANMAACMCAWSMYTACMHILEGTGLYASGAAKCPFPFQWSKTVLIQVLLIRGEIC